MSMLAKAIVDKLGSTAGGSRVAETAEKLANVMAVVKAKMRLKDALFRARANLSSEKANDSDVQLQHLSTTPSLRSTKSMDSQPLVSTSSERSETVSRPQTEGEATHVVNDDV